MIDIVDIASKTAEYLAPALPFLLEEGKRAGNKALEGLYQKIGADGFDKTKKLLSKLRKKDGIKQAAEQVVEGDDTQAAVNNLKMQLIACLAQDQDLAQMADDWNKQVPSQVKNWETLFSVKNLTGILAEEVHANTIVTGNQTTNITHIHHTVPDAILASGEAQEEHTTQQQPRELRRYLEKLRNYCNVLPLSVLYEDGDLKLESIYTELDTTTNRADIEKKGMQLPTRLFDERTEEDPEDIPLSASDVAAISDRLVLLGGPGSGKSSFVKQLASQLAAATLGETESVAGWSSDVVPVFVVLHEFATLIAKSGVIETPAKNKNTIFYQLFLEYIKTYLENALILAEDEYYTLVKRLLEDGKVVLIFDGLDEVPDNQRRLIRDTVSAVTHSIDSKCKTLVTCRVRSYGDDVRFSGYKEFTLASLNVEKRKLFIRSWYEAYRDCGSMSSDKAENQIADLCQKVAGDNLGEMSENPMMLTNMIMLHRKKTRLPEERVRLYKEVVLLLLSRWQMSNDIPVGRGLKILLQDEDKIFRLVKRLAYEAQSRQVDADDDLMRKDLVDWLGEKKYLGCSGLADQFLDYVDKRAGLLMGLGGGDGDKPKVYTFPHRTFREYLAGCYLLENDRTDRTVSKFRPLVELGESWALAVQLGAEEMLYNLERRNSLLDLMYSLCKDGEKETIQDWRGVVASARMAMLFDKNEIMEDEEGGDTYLMRLIPLSVNGLRCGLLTPFERNDLAKLLAAFGDPRFDPECCFLPRDEHCGFVKIGAGKFLMGPDNRDSDEKRCHEVGLGDYYIGKHVVTVDQYRLYLKHMKKAIDPELKEQDGNLPITRVSFIDAIGYCQWLTEQLKVSAKTPVELQERLRDGWSVTLPSEAEWEKAARWTDGRTYPWGSNFDAGKANFHETGLGSTSAVGCFYFGHSVYEIEDMAGNVWEWTRSLYSNDFPYPYKPEEKRREDIHASDSVSRVVRGGCFYNDTNYLRSALRYWYHPGGRNLNIGFRVVLSPFSQSER
ncbi:SUMF1/EgtB/PvdO family nonheme iron enzyme [Desulfosediminicola flagellatus]|uniref:SUMF1/EgtB/PvdO family nonheme iron enzyme n=1 Tax=Desulfosediminicola flagellatus TaxID=2569541 RepID=UPI0010AB9C41|nr:SUMF1/EgtB/PvdO family nonheme iron enzyme [Desulfosediminicola flagellatus]